MHVLIAGDLCPQGRPEEFLASASAEDFWNPIADVTRAHDLCIVNLECPLTCSDTPISKEGPHLRADSRCAAGIRAGGFDVVTLANNHILDMGEQGLFDTLQACQEAGLKTVGAGGNLTEATRPLIVEVGETKIAVLAFAEHEFSIASRATAGAWPLDVIDNHYQIALARKRADFVLIVLHGGNEGYPLPSPRVVKICRYFVDLGASAVVCHHSHVASGMEVVQQGVPIIYGTGNFLFDWPTPRPAGWYTGYMVSLKVQGSAVTEVELVPYVQCHEKPGVRLMQGEEAKSFHQEIARLSDIIERWDTLMREWQAFCRGKQTEYLARLVSSHRLEEFLWNRGLFSPRCIKNRIPGLLNLVRCQAHREVLTEILQQNIHW